MIYRGKDKLAEALKNGLLNETAKKEAPLPQGPVVNPDVTINRTVADISAVAESLKVKKPLWAQKLVEAKPAIVVEEKVVAKKAKFDDRKLFENFDASKSIDTPEIKTSIENVSEAVSRQKRSQFHGTYEMIGESTEPKHKFNKVLSQHGYKYTGSHTEKSLGGRDHDFPSHNYEHAATGAKVHVWQQKGSADTWHSRQKQKNGITAPGHGDSKPQLDKHLKRWKEYHGLNEERATNKLVNEAKPYEHEYNKDSVDQAIKSSSRFGKKIGKREGKLIHSLLKGHSKPKPVKEEQLDEGRPSQRHALEGHDYHRKTNSELEYIGKDAHKAAQAMRDHNPTAEAKYLDQANDAATVRHFRKQNGMPEWYRKKYGHIKEEVEQLDEISSDLAKNYTKKAKQSIDGARNERRKVFVDGLGKSEKFKKNLMNRWNKATKTIDKRSKGISQASDRIHEEVEQLDELSKGTLGRYIKKSSAKLNDHSSNASELAHRAHTDLKKSEDETRPDYVRNAHLNSARSMESLAYKQYHKADNRMKGIERATNRIVKEDVEQLDEVSQATKDAYKTASWKSEYNARIDKGSATVFNNTHEIEKANNTIRKRTRGQELVKSNLMKKIKRDK